MASDLLQGTSRSTSVGFQWYTLYKAKLNFSVVHCPILKLIMSVVYLFCYRLKVILLFFLLCVRSIFTGGSSGLSLQFCLPCPSQRNRTSCYRRGNPSWKGPVLGMETGMDIQLLISVLKFRELERQGYKPGSQFLGDLSQRSRCIHPGHFNWVIMFPMENNSLKTFNHSQWDS